MQCKLKQKEQWNIMKQVSINFSLFIYLIETQFKLNRIPKENR